MKPKVSRRGPPSYCGHSALASVVEGPKNSAGVLVHDLSKVHGDGEKKDKEEKVDAKE